jgi:hypothetical protein
MTEEMKLSLTEEEALLVRVLVIQKNSELKNKVKEGASLCEFLAGIQATAEVVEEKMRLAEKARVNAMLKTAGVVK